MKKVSENIKCIIMLFVVFAVISNSAVAKAGAIKGIKLSLDVIIPSLLSVLILTGTLSESNMKNIINKIFSPVSKYIFHLNYECASPIFFGLIGGYPAGAVLTNNAYNNGLITKEEAQKIMYFNVCPGVAFTINAVGSLYNDNGKTGIVLYLICVLSSVITGIIMGVFHKSQSNQNQDISYTRLGEAFAKSVIQTKDNLLVMSCYIIFFSTLANLLSIPDMLSPFIEITNGIFSSNKTIPFEYICFFLQFAGFCIHFQIMGIIKSFDMKYHKFLLGRVISALLCYFPGKILTESLAGNEEVFSNISYTIPKESEFGKGLGMLLLFGCVLIICDIKNKKSKLL